MSGWPGELLVRWGPTKTGHWSQITGRPRAELRCEIGRSNPRSDRLSAAHSVNSPSPEFDDERGRQESGEQLRTGGQAPTFVCNDKGTEKPLPAGFPTTFALPDGSVVIGSEKRSGEGRVIVYAISPHDVKSTLHSMQQIPTVGFKLTEGEVEETTPSRTGPATASSVDGRSARCPTAPTRHRSQSWPKGNNEQSGRPRLLASLEQLHSRPTKLMRWR